MTAQGLFWSGCRWLGLNALSRRLHRSHLLVLCYHGVVSEPVDDPASSGNAVTAAEFEGHLAALVRWFTPVSGQQVRRWLMSGEPLPPRPVLVTFDDGYRNNLLLAGPLLRRYSIPALFFLTTGYLGTDRVLWGPEVFRRVVSWPEEEIKSPAGARLSLPAAPEPRTQVARRVREECKTIPDAKRLAYLDYLRSAPAPSRDEELDAFLSWEEARALAAQGFELGSHTLEHPVLSQLGEAELTEELTESKRIIEAETGVECYGLAYPFGRPGHYSPEVLAAAEAAGYDLAFTIGAERRATPGSRYAIARLGVAGHRPQAVFEASVSGTRARLRRS